MSAHDCPKYQKLRKASQKAWKAWQQMRKAGELNPSDARRLEEFYVNSARAVLNHQQNCPLCQSA